MDNPHPTPDAHPDFFSDHSITRRRLLAGVAQAGVAVGGAGLLAACGASGTPGTTGTSATLTANGALYELAGGKPVRGGTMTVGSITGGSAETINPGLALLPIDFGRSYNLYNCLWLPGRTMYPLLPQLALSAESNKAATLWTINLRDGVRWHDGKPFTADDVVYSMQANWADSSENYGSAALINRVNFKGIRRRDRLTVEVPLHTPIAQFPTLIAGVSLMIIQNGTTKKDLTSNPIGTGPFKFVSFTPGSESVFARNPDYWEEGKPYVDKLIINSSFSDQTSMLNALLSGAVDVVAQLDPSAARQQLNSRQVQLMANKLATATYSITMRVDRAPFTDNRVRQAMKLVADRPALVNEIFSGFGSVENDILAPGVQYFASDLKRERDVEKAKFLIKSAGYADHTFVLPTSNAVVGQKESATLFAQQASDAGIKIALRDLSSSVYYTSAGGFTTRPFAQDENDTPFPSLTAVYLFELIPIAPYGDSHWGAQKPGGPAALKLVNQAIAATDSSLAAELWHKAQVQQFNEGGMLSWGNLQYLDAAANNVRGLKAGSGGDFNNWRFVDGWLT